MKFESKLANSIAGRKDGKRPWKTYACLVGAVFIVLNLAASSLAAPSAVIHVASKTTVAEYLGNFDGKTGVLRLGLVLSTDSAVIKVPFKGRLTDLKTFSFSEFVEASGGGTFEPYVMIRLPEGRALTCDPTDSYSDGGWYLPLFEWQARELVSSNAWKLVSGDPSQAMSAMSTWIDLLGNPLVISIELWVGPWTISEDYSGLVGDIAINGVTMNIANARRV